MANCQYNYTYLGQSALPPSTLIDEEGGKI